MLDIPPSITTSDLITLGQHKLNCLMFTASREISEHLSLWPVTLTRRKWRNMSSPSWTSPSQGIRININIDWESLTGCMSWQQHVSSLGKNWSRVAVITTQCSHTTHYTWSCQYVTQRYFLKLRCHPQYIWLKLIHTITISHVTVWNSYIDKVGFHLHLKPSNKLSVTCDRTISDLETSWYEFIAKQKSLLCHLNDMSGSWHLRIVFRKPNLETST